MVGEQRSLIDTIRERQRNWIGRKLIIFIHMRTFWKRKLNWMGLVHDKYTKLSYSELKSNNQ